MLPLVEGGNRPGFDAGHLIMPRQGNSPKSLDLKPQRWAMESGGYHGFSAGPFMRMLERFWQIPGCLFVVAPDFVGDHASTREAWPFWSRQIKGAGFPAAFVVQEGVNAADVPWSEMAALFVGGESDAFKEGPLVRSLCGIAKARGLWVHWGRVNGKRRYEMALKSGADSFDGSSFSWYSKTNLPKATEQWPREIQQQPELGL